jgi:hypothetical protein
MTLDKGDPFEVLHQKWLREMLPFYEVVWRDFIGNDGSNYPLPIDGLTPDQANRRCKFYQAHYTMALRCFAIHEIMQRASERLVAVDDNESLRKEFEFLYQFMASIGHVRDMFKIMDDALKLRGSVVGQLQEFYDVRSHVLHGPQMPYFVDVEHGFLNIPRVAARNKVEGEWDDACCWYDMKPDMFITAADFCFDTGRDFFATVNKIHSAIHAGAASLFDGKRIDWSRRVVIPLLEGFQTTMPMSIGIGSGNARIMMGKVPIASGGMMRQIKS